MFPVLSTNPNSSIEKLPGTDRIMLIKKVAFVAAAIRGVEIFRLPHRATPTYVSDRFVERYTSAHLHGLDINPIWST